MAAITTKKLVKGKATTVKARRYEPVFRSLDQAIGEFALAYADQNEKDHAALVAAVKAGRIKALVEEEKE